MYLHVNLKIIHPNRGRLVNSANNTEKWLDNHLFYGYSPNKIILKIGLPTLPEIKDGMIKFEEKIFLFWSIVLSLSALSLKCWSEETTILTSHAYVLLPLTTRKCHNQEKSQNCARVSPLGIGLFSLRFGFNLHKKILEKAPWEILESSGDATPKLQISVPCLGWTCFNWGVPTTLEPHTSAKVSRYKWKAYRDTNWWCIGYFLPSGGHVFAKYRDRNGRCIAILFNSIGVRGRLWGGGQLLGKLCCMDTVLDWSWHRAPDGCAAVATFMASPGTCQRQRQPLR